MKTLVIIPTYNEWESLPFLLTALQAVKDIDILFVDDNSPDGTADYIKNLPEYNLNIFLLERSAKAGLASAYLAGFAWGLKHDYEVLVQMDADLSHDPKALPEILAALEQHHGVIGSRYVKGGGVANWPISRRLISRGGSLYAKLLLGLPYQDLTGGFNAWRAETLRVIDLPKIKSGGYSFQIELKHLAHQAGLKLHEVPIVFKERANGQSKMSKKIFIEAVWRVPRLMLNTRFVRFLIVGFSGLIIDLGLTIFLVEIFKVNVYMAGGLAFVLAAINNFVLNKFWAFKNKQKNYSKQFLIFLLISAIGLIWNLLCLKIFISLGMWYALAKLLAAVVVALWNYFLNKWWTFNTPPLLAAASSTSPYQGEEKR